MRLAILTTASARGPRFRVDAEIVRDIALAVERLVVRPAWRTQRVSARSRFSFPAAGQLRPEDLEGRKGPRPLSPRHLHVPLSLGSVPGVQTFNAPNGDFSCVRRARSNTPLQALTSLNEPLFLECARALALKTVWSGGTDNRQRLDLRLPPLPSRANRTRRSDRALDALRERAKALRG